MPNLEVRKVIKVGETSFAVILPLSWLRFYKYPKQVKVTTYDDKIVIEIIKPNELLW